MQDDWQPKVGETVIYKQRRLVKGLQRPERRVTVCGLYQNGWVGVRGLAPKVRAVELANLKPIE